MTTTIAIREQLRKRVVKSGNSGAVWVPKDWLGEEIIVTRLKTPKLALEERILKIILPHLSKISGLFLYGSHVRGEETQNSDIDILVIAQEKIDIRPPKGYDVTTIQSSKIERTLNRNPLVLQWIKEAKPIINTSLLNELKQKKLSKSGIKGFISATKESLNSTKELIELDKLDGDTIQSYSILYSIFMRLRGAYIIDCLEKNNTFTNKSFKKWLTKYISASEYEKVYKAYTAIRDDRKVKGITINIKTAELLVALLQRWLTGRKD